MTARGSAEKVVLFTAHSGTPQDERQLHQRFHAGGQGCDGHSILAMSEHWSKENQKS